MLWTAFILGLIGSFHCVGMCGPIALALSARDQKKYWGNKLFYNMGRILTYSLLGALIGLVGFSLALTGIQQWLSIGMGVLILGMSFFYRRAELLIARSSMLGGIRQLKSSLGKYLKYGGSSAFFVSGMLNGLLPCGMVYIALVASLAMQGVLSGFLYMFFFGLGTIPSLMILMYSKDLLSISLRQRMNRMLPYFAMFIGILFILRGLGLGIHFISPKLNLPSVNAMEMVDGEITDCD
ncbi:MAG: sulfite exporter TauE/SafE family protein [Cyclobacteriaceae bacterium]